MYGFKQGVEVAKQIIKTDFFKNKNENNIFLNIPNADKINFKTINKPFSESFEPGKGKEIATELLESRKMDIIFPVAGPQIGDVLSIIKNKNLNAKLIGVDIDQVPLYEPDLKNDQDSEFFITSAEKKISNMIMSQLEIIKSETQREDNSYGYKDDATGISEKGIYQKNNKDILS